MFNVWLLIWESLSLRRLRMLHTRGKEVRSILSADRYSTSITHNTEVLKVFTKSNIMVTFTKNHPCIATGVIQFFWKVISDQLALFAVSEFEFYLIYSLILNELWSVSLIFFLLLFLSFLEGMLSAPIPTRIPYLATTTKNLPTTPTLDAIPCFYNGIRYKLWDVFSLDDCNTCDCLYHGFVHCTDRKCMAKNG